MMQHQAMGSAEQLEEARKLEAEGATTKHELLKELQDMDDLSSMLREYHEAMTKEEGIDIDSLIALEEQLEEKAEEEPYNNKETTPGKLLDSFLTRLKAVL